MAASLGVGIAGIFSIGPRFAFASEWQCLAQGLARRLICRRGSLPWDPNAGTDMRDFLNSSFTPRHQFDAQRACKDECEKDERVESASVDAKYNRLTSAMTLDISILTAQGPFQLVLLVDKLTIKILDVT